MNEKNPFKVMKENKDGIDLNKKNNYMLYLQVFSVIVAVSLLILSLIYKEKKITPFFDLSLAISMAILAYNNHTRYKRKYFTVIYSVIALLLLIASIAGLIK